MNLIVPECKLTPRIILTETECKLIPRINLIETECTCKLTVGIKLIEPECKLTPRINLTETSRINLIEIECRLESIWLKQNVSLLIESIWLKQNVSLLLEWIWLKQNVSLRLGHTTSKAKSELFKICPVDMKLTIHSDFCISVLSADVIPNCRCSFHFLLSIEHKRLNSWHQFAFYCNLLIKQIDLVTHIWDARGVLQYRSPTYIIVPRIWDASVLFIMQVDIRLRTVYRSKCSASRLWNVWTPSCLNAFVSHWIGFNE